MTDDSLLTDACRQLLTSIKMSDGRTDDRDGMYVEALVNDLKAFTHTPEEALSFYLAVATMRANARIALITHDPLLRLDAFDRAIDAFRLLTGKFANEALSADDVKDVLSGIIDIATAPDRSEFGILDIDVGVRELILAYVNFALEAFDTDESLANGVHIILVQLFALIMASEHPSFEELREVSALRTKNLDAISTIRNMSTLWLRRRAMALLDEAEAMRRRDGVGDLDIAVEYAASAHAIAHKIRSRLIDISMNMQIYVLTVALYVSLLEAQDKQIHADKVARLLASAEVDIMNNSFIDVAYQFDQFRRSLEKLTELNDDDINSLDESPQQAISDTSVVHLDPDRLPNSTHVDEDCVDAVSDTGTAHANQEMVHNCVSSLGVLASAYLPKSNFSHDPLWSNRPRKLTPVALATRASRIARNAAVANCSSQPSLETWVDALITQCEVMYKSSLDEVDRSIPIAQLAYSICKRLDFADDPRMSRQADALEQWHVACLAGVNCEFEYYKNVLRIGVAFWARRSARLPSDAHARKRTLYFLEMLHYAHCLDDEISTDLVAPYRRAVDIYDELILLDPQFEVEEPNPHLAGVIAAFDSQHEIT